MKTPARRGCKPPPGRLYGIRGSKKWGTRRKWRGKIKGFEHKRRNRQTRHDKSYIQEV